jgi:hypothetical protein
LKQSVIIGILRDLCTGINEFKNSYQPTANLVKDEKGNLLPDCHRILKRSKNHFFQLSNGHGINEVRWTDIKLSHWYSSLVLPRLRGLLKS